MGRRRMIGVALALFALGAVAYDADLPWKYESRRPADVVATRSSSAWTDGLEARVFDRGIASALAELEARFRLSEESDGVNLDARRPSGLVLLLK